MALELSILFHTSAEQHEWVSTSWRRVDFAMQVLDEDPCKSGAAIFTEVPPF
jgi:hypothetical protein